MKATLCSLALVLFAAACTSKPDDPQLQFATVGFVLQLPPAMQQALDSLIPGFRTVRSGSFRTDVAQAAASDGGGLQAMFATVADFDGDGTRDAVIEGAPPGDSALTIVAIMNGAKPKAFVVARYPVYDADAVGLYLVQPTGSKAGSFKLVNYPDSSTIYQYSGGTFVGTKVAQ